MRTARFLDKHKEEKRRKEEELLEQFNKVYSGGMAQRDKEFLENAKDYRRRRFSNG